MDLGIIGGIMGRLYIPYKLNLISLKDEVACIYYFYDFRGIRYGIMLNVKESDS